MVPRAVSQVGRSPGIDFAIVPPQTYLTGGVQLPIAVRTVRVVAENIPDALAELVLQLLEKNPEDRPRTAALVCERLQQIARSLG